MAASTGGGAVSRLVAAGPIGTPRPRKPFSLSSPHAEERPWVVCGCRPVGRLATRDARRPGRDRDPDLEHGAEPVLDHATGSPRDSWPALPWTARPEPFGAHVARLGALPRGLGRRDLISDLEASGLLGRGGAGFPVGRKWRAHGGAQPRPGRRRRERRRRGARERQGSGPDGEPAAPRDRRGRPGRRGGRRRRDRLLHRDGARSGRRGDQPGARRAARARSASRPAS